MPRFFFRCQTAAWVDGRGNALGGTLPRNHCRLRGLSDPCVGCSIEENLGESSQADNKPTANCFRSALRTQLQFENIGPSAHPGWPFWGGQVRVDIELASRHRAGALAGGRKTTRSGNVIHQMPLALSWPRRFVPGCTAFPLGCRPVARRGRRSLSCPSDR